MALPLKKCSGAFDTLVGAILLICSMGGLANSTLTVKTVAFLLVTLGLGSYVLVSGIRKLKASK